MPNKGEQPSSNEQSIVADKCDTYTCIDYRCIQSVNAESQPRDALKSTSTLDQHSSSKFGSGSPNNKTLENLLDCREQSVPGTESHATPGPNVKHATSADTSSTGEPLVQKSTQNKRRTQSKPKVSLLAQLLESESDTETKILPKLLDTDDKSKNGTKKSEEKREEKLETEKNENKECDPCTDNVIAPEPIMPTTSTNFIDGVLSYSDADEMLNMMNMHDLPDSLFNVDISADGLNIECDQAMESIGMMSDVNSMLLNENAQPTESLPPPQATQQQFNLGFKPHHVPGPDRESPEIDLHPHNDGVVEDFPVSLSQTSSMTSPALARSLGKIVGRPLNTSSPNTKVNDILGNLKNYCIPLTFDTS